MSRLPVIASECQMRKHDQPGANAESASFDTNTVLYRLTFRRSSSKARPI